MVWKLPLKTCQESTLNNSPQYTKYFDCGKMVSIIFCEFLILSNICLLLRGKFLQKRLCLASYQCPLFSLTKKESKENQLLLGNKTFSVQVKTNNQKQIFFIKIYLKVQSLKIAYLVNYAGQLVMNSSYSSLKFVIFLNIVDSRYLELLRDQTKSSRQRDF